jgi:hypothetical protein
MFYIIIAGINAHQATGATNRRGYRLLERVVTRHIEFLHFQKENATTSPETHSLLFIYENECCVWFAFSGKMGE